MNSVKLVLVLCGLLVVSSRADPEAEDKIREAIEAIEDIRNQFTGFMKFRDEEHEA